MDIFRTRLKFTHANRWRFRRQSCVQSQMNSGSLEKPRTNIRPFACASSTSEHWSTLSRNLQYCCCVKQQLNRSESWWALTSPNLLYFSFTSASSYVNLAVGCLFKIIIHFDAHFVNWKSLRFTFHQTRSSCLGPLFVWESFSVHCGITCVACVGSREFHGKCIRSRMSQFSMRTVAFIQSYEYSFWSEKFAGRWWNNFHPSCHPNSAMFHVKVQTTRLQKSKFLLVIGSPLAVDCHSPCGTFLRLNEKAWWRNWVRKSKVTSGTWEC